MFTISKTLSARLMLLGYGATLATLFIFGCMAMLTSPHAGSATEIFAATAALSAVFALLVIAKKSAAPDHQAPALHPVSQSLIKAGALQHAIFNSANFSSIATDAQGVIQIFNVGA